MLSNASVAYRQRKSSSNSSFTLSVNGSDYAVQPAAANLNSLATAINSSERRCRRSSLARISGVAQLSAHYSEYGLGDSSIQLNDGTDLMSSLTTGTDASYTVNAQRRVES